MFDKLTNADPVGIMSTPYFTTYSDMTEIFDEGKIKLEIGQHIYDLRASTSRTQTEFAEFVGVEESIVADLEEGDYEGDSLAVLAHIEKAVRRHISAVFA